MLDEGLHNRQNGGQMALRILAGEDAADGLRGGHRAGWLTGLEDVIAEDITIQGSMIPHPLDPLLARNLRYRYRDVFYKIHEERGAREGE